MPTRINKPDYKNRDYSSDKAQAVGAASPPELDDLIHLKSGVVLRRKPVPLFRIQRAVAQLEEPKMPVIEYEDGRKTSNKDDPDYLAALAEYRQQVSQLSIDIMCAFGTEIHFVPEDVSAVDDEGWIEECAVFNIEVKTEPPAVRYINWIQLVAITDEEDLQVILGQYVRGVGASQERVASAVASFPDHTERDTDHTSSAAQPTE